MNREKENTDVYWNHATVYAALVNQGLRVKESDRNKYVVLYDQDPNCAILYAPDSENYRSVPLHLHPGRESWRTDFYTQILPAISSVKLERRTHQPFLHCTVIWERFAEVLDLDPD